jgi:hypothetical protein
MYHFKHYIRIRANGNVSEGTSVSAAARQAIVYSLLLHQRVLLDFFYSPPRHDDDCWVGHFRALPEFEQRFPDTLFKVPSFKRELGRNLNKRLAHFTTVRWKERQPVLQEYERYFGEIEVLIEQFVDALPTPMKNKVLERFRQWDVQYKVMTPSRYGIDGTTRR